jgi:HEAT repeat protein
VRDQAARQLGILGDERAIEPLFRSLRESHFRRTAEALASFREKRAMPDIIEMLEDDYARETAGKALLEFGKDAVLPLTETLSQPNYTPSRNETSLSVERRSEAARLLGEIGDPRAIRPLLKRLEDEQKEVRLSAALSLLEIGANRDEIVRAIPELIAGLDEGDWYTTNLCIDALLELNSVALPFIEHVLSKRTIENVKNEKVNLSQKTVECLNRIEETIKAKFHRNIDGD